VTRGEGIGAHFVPFSLVGSGEALLFALTTEMLGQLKSNGSRTIERNGGVLFVLLRGLVLLHLLHQLGQRGQRTSFQTNQTSRGVQSFVIEPSLFHSQLN